MSLLPRAAVSFAWVVIGCQSESPAAPVRRARTTDGAPVYWSTAEVVLEPIVPSPASGLTQNDLVNALGKAVQAWNDALSTCTAPRLRVAEPSPGGSARTDGRNVVVVRSDAWCPADAHATTGCYAPTLQAMTELRVRTGPSPPGALREADIEVNAVDFKWSLDGERPGTRSLTALFAHELGHVLGLRDSCADRAVPNGEIPLCAAAAARGLRASIMYPNPTEKGRPLVLVPGVDATGPLCREEHIGAR